MNEQEMIEGIATKLCLFCGEYDSITQGNCSIEGENLCEFTLEQAAQIHSHYYKKAGWKSPEEVIEKGRKWYEEGLEEGTKQGLAVACASPAGAFEQFLKVASYVKLCEDQELPKYDFTNTPTYFESGYNIAQQDMLETENGCAFRKVKLEQDKAVEYVPSGYQVKKGDNVMLEVKE